MMKKLLWLFILIFIVALPAAASNVPDLSRTGSIHITMQYDGNPVSGGTFTLYHVGEICEEDGNYSFVPEAQFSSSGIPLENMQSPETAKSLSDYALKKGIAGQTEKISSTGKASFGELEPGLYLLVQRKAAQGYQKVNPFLVTLPMQSGDGYTYQVDASPKVSPLLSRPENPEQPKTGQSGWPIWVFLYSGAALTALVCFRKRT